MTSFEQSNEFNSTCILFLDIVDEIIKKHNILIMDLKICMLLMKYKIYHFYFICILIHNIPLKKNYYYGKYDKKIAQQ